MLRFKRRQTLEIRSYRKKRSKKFKVLITLLLVWCVVSGILYLGVSWFIAKKVEEIKRLQKENAELRLDIKELKTSSKAYEELIRRKLGYIKDGEKIVIYSKNPGR